MAAKNTRHVVTAVGVLVAAASLAACSASPGGNSTNGGGRTYTLQVGAPNPTTNADTAAIQAWADAVKKDTNGEINIVVQASDALGSNATQVSAVQTGSQFAFEATAGDLEGLDPLFSITNLPYTFPGGLDQMKTLLNGYLGDQLDQALSSKGITGVGWMSVGPRNILSKKPIVHPSDLVGVKFRVQPAPSIESGYKALGADVQPVSIDQVYTALSTGAVDGLENSPSSLLHNKFDEVAKYYSPTNMLYTAASLIVSTQVLSTLPTADQTIIANDAKTAMDAEWAAYQAGDDDALKQMQAAGVTVEQINEDEWVQAVGNAGEDFAKSEGDAVYQVYEQVKAQEKN